eukprot:TRINITY_DN42244_c0_g1_i1.p1 TRINITY_DN42244_c0_g1~~TRINITY_DN42244_c0_g1_i1.p1  ORF type:complete len:449 (+),score=151.23 TRINITY_DN42244_c0_g1_i1:73-1419(+)
MFHSPRKVPKRLPLPRVSDLKGAKAVSSSPRRIRPFRIPGEKPRTALPSTRNSFQAAGSLEFAALEDERCQTAASVTEGSPGIFSRTFQGPVEGWAAVQELEQIETREREAERKQRAHKLKHEHLEALNEQRDRRLREKDEFREVWKRWRDEVEADAQRFREEEESKKQRQLEVLKRFNEEREKQLEEARQRTIAKKQADARDGEEMLRKAKVAKDQAERDEHLRKSKERAQAIRLMEDLRAAKHQKDKLKQEELSRDILMAQKQKEMLEKQEAERASWFQKVKDKQSKMLAAYEAGVGNELERRAKEDAERARRYQEVIAEKERRVEEEKQQKVLALKKASFDEVQYQIQEHERQKQVLKEEEQRQMLELQAQAKEYDEKERAKREEARKKREDNAAFLREQIRQRQEPAPGRPGKDQMNEVEKQLNKDKLDRLAAKAYQQKSLSAR